MDAVTKYVLEALSEEYPLAAIRLTHQFLDGDIGRPCGLVPNAWDGKTQFVVTGKWWQYAS